jgi:hypothetical protein
VRRLHLAVRRRYPAHLVCDVSEGHVGSNEGNGDREGFQHRIPAPAVKDRREAVLDFSDALHRFTPDRNESRPWEAAEASPGLCVVFVERLNCRGNHSLDGLLLAAAARTLLGVRYRGHGRLLQYRGLTERR